MTTIRSLSLRLAGDDRPIYLRLAEALRQAIHAGRARPGEALPSARQLAEHIGAHRHTVMAALDELVAEGWVVAETRRGYRVSAELPAASFRPAGRPRTLPTKPTKHAWRLVRAASADAPYPDASVKYAFQSGQPDLRAFPFAEFRGHVTDALRRPSPRTFAYGRSSGHEPLLNALAAYLRRLRGIDDRGLIVTHGSQEAIFIAAQLLVAPGDRVAVEALGYPPAWEALRAAGARLEPVPVDQDGLDPDAFDALCQKRRIRLLYVTPLHQYPTTVTLPVARRMRLYEVALRHGVPILEDDYDHEYHYRCQPLAPLAATDPAGLVLYVGTFTKVLFPSMRIGYMAVPAALHAAATRFRRITSNQNDALLQDAVARWIGDGGLERHLRRMARLYEERLMALDDALEVGRQRGIPLTWRVPDGGMALWLGVPAPTAQVARAAAKAGVFVHIEEQFQLARRRGTHLRLGFAALTPEEIRLGIRALLDAVTRPSPG